MYGSKNTKEKRKVIRKGVHIALLLALLLLMGCTAEKELFQGGGPGVELTVRCDNPLLVTKADPESTKNGELSYNENLIKSVDFFFYPGKSPDPKVNAVYHIRKEIENTNWEYTFDLIIKKDFIPLIFLEANDYKATIYTLVNFDTSFFDTLPGTSLKDFAEARLTTDFAQEETNYIQSRFPMDGMTVVTYYENEHPNVCGEIEVKRFASKLTLAVHLADEAILEHRSKDSNQDPEPAETWKPVPHTMRLYLVAGAKTVRLSHDGTTLPDPDAIDSTPEYFSYRDEKSQVQEHIRPFLNENGLSYVEDSPETIDGKVYYKTYPMYSYPREWNYDRWDYEHHIDYTEGNPHEPPYLKLEMDWRREAKDGYTYDRRKYYYKIVLPFTKFVRNNWYGMYLDVSILGSETDEGQATLDPTCYLLDWQNKSVAINKVAVISKARFLSVDKKEWEINNMDELSIPFQSSHNVVIVPSSIKATRPYYAEIKENEEGLGVGDYNNDFHATICYNEDSGDYYLDYTQPMGKQYDDYRPAKWLTNTSTSILLDHPLENRYNETSVTNFDYSPYTIEFDIVHEDLAPYPNTITYQQYVRHITITQYPGIYIECLHNRDQEIVQIGNDGGGYPNHPEHKPWLDYPWGYVYVNGGRFIRQDPGNKDPYFDLSKAKYKQEYQWQAVYYTGGSKDIYDIHVTVLPSSSDFVIGDPRVDVLANEAEGTNHLKDKDKYRNLYTFTVEDDDEDDLKILKENFQYQQPYPTPPIITPYDDNRTRTGFNVATALYGDSPRSLKWYYPTEKSSRTTNMLAPSYRISTKLGGTEFGSITQEVAEYRCAGYQEDGLPAGRWRLPTKAEVKFIAELSAKKYIIYIFTKGGKESATYWSAHGPITVNGASGSVTTSNSTTALLRCVYDSWYWDEVDRQEGLKETGDDPRFDNPTTKVPTTFYWGDKQR